MPRQLSRREIFTIAYIAGVVLIAGTYGYTIYKKYHGETFKPNNAYFLGLALVGVAYAERIHAHGKTQKWW